MSDGKPSPNEHTVVLQAPADRVLHIWFEPWAQGLGFPAGTSVELHATSSVEGNLELDITEERTAVYGWAGSTLQVIVDGEVAHSFDQPVPEAFGRLSTKETVSMLFGPPPMPTEAKGLKPRIKSWWRRLFARIGEA